MTSVQQLSDQVDEYIASLKNLADKAEARSRIMSEDFIWTLLALSKDDKASATYWNTVAKHFGAPQAGEKDDLIEYRFHWFKWIIDNVDCSNYSDILAEMRTTLVKFCSSLPHDQAKLIFEIEKFQIFQDKKNVSGLLKKLRRLQRSITRSYLSKFMYIFPYPFQKMRTLSAKYNWRFGARFFQKRGFAADKNDLIIPLAWIYNRTTDQNREYILNALEKIWEEEFFLIV